MYDKNKNRKLSMIHLKSKGYSYKAIGKMFDVSRARVQQIIKHYVSPSNGSKLLKSIYKKVYERNNHFCWLCKTNQAVLVHHIDGNNQNNGMNNLICLCAQCHTSLHKQDILSNRPKSRLDIMLEKTNQVSL